EEGDGQRVHRPADQGSGTTRSGSRDRCQTDKRANCAHQVVPAWRTGGHRGGQAAEWRRDSPEHPAEIMPYAKILKGRTQILMWRTTQPIDKGVPRLPRRSASLPVQWAQEDV